MLRRKGSCAFPRESSSRGRRDIPEGAQEAEQLHQLGMLRQPRMQEVLEDAAMGEV